MPAPPDWDARLGRLWADVQLRRLPEVCEGLEVEFPEPLPEHARRLMETLGVKIRGEGNEVLPSDSRAGSQAGLNGPSGSPPPSPRRGSVRPVGDRLAA